MVSNEGIRMEKELLPLRKKSKNFVHIENPVAFYLSYVFQNSFHELNTTEKRSRKRKGTCATLLHLWPNRIN